MSYLTLFLTFLEIGAFSFGGGYAMISLIRDKTLMHGLLTEEELLNMIAVAESTPGPIAVNMATFVGRSEGGILGAFLATLGIVLPSFIVILLIAAIFRRFLQFMGVRAALSGIRPAVIGLILATALTMMGSILFGFKTVQGGFDADFKAILLLPLLFIIDFLFKKATKKKPSPILMILIAAGTGMLLY